MARYKIYQVDAFTVQKFRGNPAGVVPNAHGLSESQMQDIARELNNSETAFIFPRDLGDLGESNFCDSSNLRESYNLDSRDSPKDSAQDSRKSSDSAKNILHPLRRGLGGGLESQSDSAQDSQDSRDSCDFDFSVRFFTPTMEVPICGHATIAANYIFAKTHGLKNATLAQKTSIGILPIKVENGDSITLTQPSANLLPPLDKTLDFANALGVENSAICDNLPIAIASNGMPFCIIPLRKNATLARLKLDFSAICAICERINCHGFYVFGADNLAQKIVHTRAFAPLVGVDEDPVTGNAAVALGAYLARFCDINAFQITQGEAINRIGEILVRVEQSHTHITGRATIAFECEISVD